MKVVAGVTTEDWETVHTITDFWDCPRLGVADFRGVPHVYACEWSHEEDDWSHVFKLAPINGEKLAKVMESWAIWRRWKEASEADALGPGDDHPALAVDRARYDALRRDVDMALRIDGLDTIAATAEFRGTWNPTHDLEVRWSPLGGDAE